MKIGFLSIRNNIFSWWHLKLVINDLTQHDQVNHQNVPLPIIQYNCNCKFQPRKNGHKFTSTLSKYTSKNVLQLHSQIKQLMHQSLYYHLRLPAFFIDYIFSSVITESPKKMHSIQCRKCLMRVSIFVESQGKSINQVQGQTNNGLCNHAGAAL